MLVQNIISMIHYQMTVDFQPHPVKPLSFSLSIRMCVCERDSTRVGLEINCQLIVYHVYDTEREKDEKKGGNHILI